jgi:hypothetical protein
VKLLGYQPTRRGVLRAATLALVGAPLVRLARFVEQRRKKKHPDDLPPIPWIGHC